MVAIDVMPGLIGGVIGVLLLLALVPAVFQGFSAQTSSEADRSFERTADRIESFCQSSNTRESNRLLEVPEAGNITIEDEEMTGWGGQNSEGELKRLGPRKLDCSSVEVVGSDSTLVEGRTRTLTKTQGIDQTSIRIE